MFGLQRADYLESLQQMYYALGRTLVLQPDSEQSFVYGNTDHPNASPRAKSVHPEGSIHAGKRDREAEGHAQRRQQAPEQAGRSQQDVEHCRRSEHAGSGLERANTKVLYSVLDWQRSHNLYHAGKHLRTALSFFLLAQVGSAGG